MNKTNKITETQLTALLNWKNRTWFFELIKSYKSNQIKINNIYYLFLFDFIIII